MKEVLKRIEVLISKHSGGNIAKFARLSEIKSTTIRSWFQFNSIPGGKFIEQIARATGVSADWLLTGKNETSKNPKEKEGIEIKLTGILHFRGKGGPSEKLKLAILEELGRIYREKQQKGIEKK